MKGKILDFNLQAGEGVISGADGERYTFKNSEWQSSDTHPAQNIEVDFSVEDGQAKAIYVDTPVVTTSSNANTAKYVYIAYLAGLLIPFVSLIGLIVAYVNKGNGPDWVDENYRYQIRTFWISFLYSFISVLLVVVFIGWFTLVLSLIWYIIRCVKGLKAIEQNKAPENVDGWFF